MNILDKLKKIKLDKVEHPELRNMVATALKNYENKENLLEIELSNYEKIYELIDTHFPIATGKLPEEPPINPKDLLSSLQANKSKKANK